MNKLSKIKWSRCLLSRIGQATTHHTELVEATNFQLGSLVAMAAATVPSGALSAAAGAEISSAQNGIVETSVRGILPFNWRSKTVRRRMKTVCEAATGSARKGRRRRAPTLEERRNLNYLVLAACSVPLGTMTWGYATFFVPPVSGGGDAIVALDAQGKEVVKSEWLQTHPVNDRTLVQGLKGDATYLIVEAADKIADFGLNAVCTHLGCVVPWSTAEKKFVCPCHGSQYDDQGKVVRGPAPLSLALAHVEIDPADKVIFKPWKETDFRTGLDPWWS